MQCQRGEPKAAADASSGSDLRGHFTARDPILVDARAHPTQGGEVPPPTTATLPSDVARGRERTAPTFTSYPLRRPERTEVDDRVARLPARQEALNRRVEHNAVEISDGKQTMTTHCRVA
jgi:hypothetical protein